MNRTPDLLITNKSSGLANGNKPMISQGKNYLCGLHIRSLPGAALASNPIPAFAPEPMHQFFHGEPAAGRAALRIGDLEIENRVARVATRGDVVLTKDKAGLALAKELQSLIGRVVGAQEAEAATTGHGGAKGG